MVKHMLRTNLSTVEKKSFCVESLFAFLLYEDSSTKNDNTVSMTILLSAASLGQVQQHWLKFP